MNVSVQGVLKTIDAYAENIDRHNPSVRKGKLSERKDLAVFSTEAKDYQQARKALVDMPDARADVIAGPRTSAPIQSPSSAAIRDSSSARRSGAACHEA